MTTVENGYSEVPAPSPVLERGAFGPAVTKLQRALAELQFDPGPVDGQFGRQTRSALKAFQESVGLPADGVYGRRTEDQLSSVLERVRHPVTASAEIPLSVSVQRVKDGRRPLSSFEVAASVWRDHEAYAGRSAALNALGHPPVNMERRLGAEWVSRVGDLLDPNALRRLPDPQERTLHGRLLICGLTVLDPDLRAVLSESGALEELLKSMTANPHELWRTAGAHPLGTEQNVRLVADTPAAEDLLDREGFANSLAALIDFQRRETRDVSSGPILIHLYGAWGSGKTSLFGFLRKSLEAPPSCLPKQSKHWLCVTFNAWCHQRTAPPWWWLMDGVYREARARHRPSGLPSLPLRHRVVIWIWWWGLALAALIVAGAALATAAVFGVLSIDRMAGTTDALNVVAGFFVAAGGALALLRSTKSSLLVGSPRAASALLKSGGDPYRRIRERYAKLIERTGRNVLVFIDDLDRCQPEYVVELLEGVQTIFNDAPVTYLVAADREWVSESFQQVYSKLGPAMSRPGRPLGYLFLEKTFAVSAPLPSVGKATQENYWDAVITGHPRRLEPISTTDRMVAKAQMAGVTMDQALATAADLAHDDLTGEARAIREKVAIRLTEEVASGRHDHVLGPYLPLLEQNPRALKRLRNAYAIAAMGRFASLEMSTDPHDIDALIRWTIVSLRWPQLACQVMANPSLLATITGGTALPPALADLRADEDLSRLLTQPVRDVAPELEKWVEAEYDHA